MRWSSRWLIPSVLVLLVGFSACSGDTSKAASDEPTNGEGVEVSAVLIDVRTPEEYAAGHLDGALNYDFEAGVFGAALADLDPSASYALYCRSGRRSALALELMKENGFTNVVDLGSVEAAAASTGRAIIG